MTLAPTRPPAVRLAVTLGCAVLFLVLGVLAADRYGIGPSLFLFALAAVCLVDVVLVQRRRATR